MGGSVGDALCVGWVVLEAPAQCISPSSVKPDAPHLYPDVDFSDDHPLEAVVQWAPPSVNKREKYLVQDSWGKNPVNFLPEQK